MKLFADRLYLTTGPDLEAIVVPRTLGEQVRARLAYLSQPTPAVVDPRNRHWTFLTARPTPHHAVPQPLQRRLGHHGVTLPQPGSRVMLPRSDDTLGWRWACEPTPGDLHLPHRALVLGAIRLAILEGTDDVPA
ncbi:hypothetical protein [Nocardia acidivorans]|uniref:hypothetical protein n=1 Tax=Nocardia acidivorans TaxID=404580 RepID=UPI0012F8A051|nr:hypothetical protein [Nocardia acidivorans]